MRLLALFNKTGSAADSINLAGPEFKANPHPYYARLRAETPILHTKMPTGEFAWLVTRYDDVVAVLKDERFVKRAASALTPEQVARQPWFRKIFKTVRRNLLSVDPPDHTRLRALVSKAFTPPLVEQMRGRIQSLSDELIDHVQPRGSFDLIRDFALPLPTTIIAEMLGVPVADRHAFHRWSNALLSAAQSTWRMMNAVPNTLLFLRYIRKFLRKRRANPQDDLTTALIRAEDAGDRMSEDELVAMVMLLLVAGHETTVNLIGNGIQALLAFPDQLEKLRTNPTLIKPAVEEFLRFTSPVEVATERYAQEDVALGDVTIKRGDMIFAVLASANRDERLFKNPDTLDIAREPNKHVAFGLATHFCLGAPLARLEGQIAIQTLLRRLPGLQLAIAPNQLRWRRGLLLRGLESLPVAFGTNGHTNQRQFILERAAGAIRE
jgi:cytochrome P450 PksS